MTAESDIVAVQGDDLLIDVISGADPGGLVDLAWFDDPLIAMLAAWVLDVRDSGP